MIEIEDFSWQAKEDRELEGMKIVIMRGKYREKYARSKTFASNELFDDEDLDLDSLFKDIFIGEVMALVEEGE